MTPDQARRGCPVCPGKPAGRRIGELSCTVSQRLTRATFDLTYCDCKALVYLDPAPSSADLRALYEESEQFSDELYTAPERASAVVEYMRSCFGRIRDRQQAKGPARILEVGAGLAWMCRAAKSLDPLNVTIGQDVSSEAARACAWVDSYHVAEVSDPAIAGHGAYDLISLTHVIEHLVDPAAVLRQCVDLLSPRGVIFITAPHRPVGWIAGSVDIGPWRDYSYTHVPAHVQYFSRQSMERLAASVGAKVAYWSDRHEDGQAFEAWLERDMPHRERPVPTVDEAWRELAQHGNTDADYFRLHFRRFIATKQRLEERWRRGGTRLLDIGCHWLHQACLYAKDGYIVTAADLPPTLDSESVKRLASSFGITLHAYDRLDSGHAFSAFPDASFDLILLTEVLEHLAFNPVSFWQEVHRILAPGGRIVVTTPNYRGLRSTVRRLQQRGILGGGGLSVDEILRTPTLGHHWKEFSLAELRRYFALLSPDFVVTRALRAEDYYGSPTRPARFARLVERSIPGLRPHLHIEVDLPEKRSGVAVEMRSGHDD
jgi:2-polyprenyl-3-methyl-5-hydroxy-6-metoxy-1,4-benzoquinol methylase